MDEEISRKAIHPTDVPPRARMKVLVDGFREVSGNGIIVDKAGNTLCAVFSGEFGLPFSTCKGIMDALAEWRDDPTARVPGPTNDETRKRSYDAANYVGLQYLTVLSHYKLHFCLIIFIISIGCSTPLRLGCASRRKYSPWGEGCSPAFFRSCSSCSGRQTRLIKKVSSVVMECVVYASEVY